MYNVNFFLSFFFLLGLKYAPVKKKMENGVIEMQSANLVIAAEGDVANAAKTGTAPKNVIINNNIFKGSNYSLKCFICYTQTLISFSGSPGTNTTIGGFFDQYCRKDLFHGSNFQCEECVRDDDFGCRLRTHCCSHFTSPGSVSCCKKKLPGPIQMHNGWCIGANTSVTGYHPERCL